MAHRRQSGANMAHVRQSGANMAHVRQSGPDAVRAYNRGSAVANFREHEVSCSLSGSPRAKALHETCPSRVTYCDLRFRKSQG